MTYNLSNSPTVRDVPARPKVLIYVRVSSPGQVARGDGLGSQEATCRLYAERMGYDVVGVFPDTITGKASKRSGLDGMLVYLRKHRNDRLIVMVDHPNRFSRDIRGHWDLRDILAAAGGRLESPNMKFGNSASDRFLENVIMAGSQYQREQNAEQTKDRMKGRLLNGFWPFIPPRGMRNERISGIGRILVRIEPEASAISEALQAFADGRLGSQAEVARFLNEHPHFSKGKRKRITNQQAHDLLTNVLYAGVIEKADWGVGRRQAKHAGLISYETFEKIEKRLTGDSRAPARTDIDGDFPLRGAVVCGHCAKPLTACWSTSKTGDRHPYYMCYNRDCDRNRKSIRRDQIEADFLLLLGSLTPRPKLGQIVHAMFSSAWEQRSAQSQAISRSYQVELAKVDAQVAKLLDRVVDATSTTVIGAFEKRIEQLEQSKLVIGEKAANARGTQGTFDELFELAMNFLTNPSELWRFGGVEHRRTVLRLAFSEPPAYSQDSGFFEPKTTMPFSVLAGVGCPLEEMAGREALTKASSFNTLNWLTGLKRGIDLIWLSPSTAHPIRPTMCGRYTDLFTWAELHGLYKLSDQMYPTAPSNLQPRYNIAPTQDVDFVALNKDRHRELMRGRWWLVPFFAKELPKGAMFNARIETIDTSGAFREPFKKRRCLIPADGYFEWTTNAEDGKKDPWLLQLPDAKGFSFAGLWAHNDNLNITSCTIITAPAVEHIAHIHGRMPVILEEGAYDAWLSGEAQGDDAKALLLDNHLDAQLQFHRVGREVNNSRYEGTDTKKPILNSL